MADADSPMYRIAVNWNDLIDEERVPLRTLVERLVGYPCKIAAMPPDDGTVNLVIFSIPSGCIKDYLDIQSSGAIGVAFDLYDETEAEDNAAALDCLSDACDSYNESIDVEFEDSDNSDAEM
jgi:hypothetical protein